MSDTEGFFGPMEDINSLPNRPKKEKTVIKKTRRGDGDKRRKQQENKNKFKRVTYETFNSINKQLKKSNKNKKNDKVGKVLESIRKHNEKVSKTPSPPELESLSKPTQSNPFIIQTEDITSSDSDSDDGLFNGEEQAEILDPRQVRMLRLARQDLNKPAQFKYRVLKKHTGGSKTRKKSKRFRNNFRKNKISRKYIMLKQCGGGKAKMGSKSKPYSSKRKAMRSRRRVCYYKKKGRTLKLKKKSKKSKKKSRRRRRR
tara:strand:+ start:1781 stop:2551 length:771 start_codon:yes stop_codon:yes gene_type:complete